LPFSFFSLSLNSFSAPLRQRLKNQAEACSGRVGFLCYKRIETIRDREDTKNLAWSARGKAEAKQLFLS